MLLLTSQSGKSEKKWCTEYTWLRFVHCFHLNKINISIQLLPKNKHGKYWHLTLYTSESSKCTEAVSFLAFHHNAAYGADTWEREGKTQGLSISRRVEGKTARFKFNATGPSWNTKTITQSARVCAALFESSRGDQGLDPETAADISCIGSTVRRKSLQQAALWIDLTSMCCNSYQHSNHDAH